MCVLVTNFIFSYVLGAYNLKLICYNIYWDPRILIIYKKNQEIQTFILNAKELVILFGRSTLYLVSIFIDYYNVDDLILFDYCKSA